MPTFWLETAFFNNAVFMFLFIMYLFQMPRTLNEWKKIAIEFENKWNFPHCLVAIDGKHILIQSPMNRGSEFLNYKRLSVLL